MGHKVQQIHESWRILSKMIRSWMTPKVHSVIRQRLWFEHIFQNCEVWWKCNPRKFPGIFFSCINKILGLFQNYSALVLQVHKPEQSFWRNSDIPVDPVGVWSHLEYKYVFVCFAFHFSRTWTYFWHQCSWNVQTNTRSRAAGASSSRSVLVNRRVKQTVDDLKKKEKKDSYSNWRPLFV